MLRQILRKLIRSFLLDVVYEAKQESRIISYFMNANGYYLLNKEKFRRVYATS